MSFRFGADLEGRELDPVVLEGAARAVAAAIGAEITWEVSPTRGRCHFAVPFATARRIEADAGTADLFDEQVALYALSSADPLPITIDFFAWPDDVECQPSFSIIHNTSANGMCPATAWELGERLAAALGTTLVNR